MMFRQYSPFRSGSRTALLWPFLALLTLTFCSQKADYSDSKTSKIYHDPKLHFDGELSEELGKLLATHYTSSGEPFTGTQKVYYTENDSLHMELYFKDGINTGSVQYIDGDTIRIKSGIYQKFPRLQEMYVNDNLVYKDVFLLKVKTEWEIFACGTITDSSPLK